NGTALALSLRKAAPRALLLAMSAPPPLHRDGYDAILKKPLSPASLRAAFGRRVSPANGSERPRASPDPKEDAVLDAEIFERLRRAIDPDGLGDAFCVCLEHTHERIRGMRHADL